MSKTQLTLPSTLPVPEKPYASWAKFIRALWEHGMSVHNIDPNLVAEHVELAVEPIREAMTRSRRLFDLPRLLLVLGKRILRQPAHLESRCPLTSGAPLQ